MAAVWLKWLDNGVVYRAAHSSASEAKAQAAVESKNYLGVFDAEDDSGKKVGDVTNSNGVKSDG